jgi:polyphosphate kinase 2 (PPK2 family)
MGDARHKRKYMDGERVQMTKRWKEKVKERLAENKRNNIYPRDQVELAEAVDAADKSAITKMLKATASKLVPRVCQVLQISVPMQERKEPDVLDRLLDGADDRKRIEIASLIRASKLLP